MEMVENLKAKGIGKGWAGGGQGGGRSSRFGVPLRAPLRRPLRVYNSRRGNRRNGNSGSQGHEVVYVSVPWSRSSHSENPFRKTGAELLVPGKAVSNPNNYLQAGCLHNMERNLKLRLCIRGSNRVVVRLKFIFIQCSEHRLSRPPPQWQK